MSEGKEAGMSSIDIRKENRDRDEREEKTAERECSE